MGETRRQEGEAGNMKTLGSQRRKLGCKLIRKIDCEDGKWMNTGVSYVET
jgi:hypothetical protein